MAYRGKFKTTINLTGDAVQKYVSLKQRTKLDTDVDVTKYALLLAHRLHQHKKDGGKIVLEAKDGSREVLTLL